MTLITLPRPDDLNRLESELTEQVNKNTYDIETNLAIVKLYRMFPEHLKTENIVLILLKALMQKPNNDFLKLNYLISEDIFMENPSMKLISELNTSLESANFAKFWASSKQMADSNIPHVAGFEEAMREFIINVLMCTYRNIPIHVLQTSLDLKESDVSAFVAKMGWESNGELVSFPPNAHNQERPKQFEESIQFSQLSGVISKLTA